MSDTLLQILIVVAIIAGIVSIAVLWRTLDVLNDLKVTTGILAKRAKELDESVEKTKQTIINMVETIKSFVLSFDFIKSIREKITNKEKGE